MKVLGRNALFGLIAVPLLALSVSGCGMMAEFLKADPDSTSEADTPSTAESSLPDSPDSNENNSQASIPTPSESISSESTLSENPNSENGATMSEILKRMNCQEPSQNDYIDGTYAIGWTIARHRHEGVLQMQGGSGIMRIKFFNANINSEDVVDQDMVLANCPQGLILLGFNPTSPDTKEAHSSYVADNLIIRIETDGSLVIMVVDDQGATASAEIEKVPN